MLINPAKLAANANVAVVGAGVGGLSFGYFLTKLRPDVNITIIDAANRTGGWINSSTIEDHGKSPVVLEKGPRTLRGKSEGTTLIVDTLNALNKKDIVCYIEGKSEANRKFLLDRNDKLVQVPNSMGSFMKFLSSSLSKGLISGILGEPFRKPRSNSGEDESAHDLIKRRFGGEYVSNNLFSAIFHGIYAGDIKQLSAQRTLAPLLALEAKHGSLIKGAWGSNAKKGELELPKSLLRYQKSLDRNLQELSELHCRLRTLPMLGLRNGLESFPQALTIALQQNPKVRFILRNAVSQVAVAKDGNCRVSLADGNEITGLDHVRLTNTPAVIAAMMSNQQLAQELREAHSNTVVLLNFYLSDVDLLERYHSFGYLVPQSNRNDEQLLGVIFDSVIEKSFKPLNPAASLSAQRKPQRYTKFTAMVGGHYLRRDSQASLPETSQDYVDKVKTALIRHLNLSQQDLDRGHWQVTTAKDCLPHFFVNYNLWVARIKAKFNEEVGLRISLGGMAFSNGPGVPDVVMDGFEDADSLAH
ncbi:LAME_0F08988g1_1 [Lachancea meyersii CBS 8951]|uniref:Protoporphyrinogen oxidase n=1 Tax=Lachancea meyersii CBS 8951 TaxID=1266667 RepID=A0A1G4JUS8_9SACH|nr:LAME_0F08988g1_1 [Lachancea meyersii CBS 8951]